MTQTAALHRSYRRLLAAYPRTYRRVRQVEMLTTLMDAARPEQRRPTLREALDLIGGGVRYRFRVPPGPVYRVAAALAALLGALAISGGAALATWTLAETVPATAVADRVARVVVPGPPATAVLSPTEQLHLDALGKGTSPGDEGYAGPAPAPESVRYAYRQSSAGPWPTEPVAALAPARARLSAEGWTVSEPARNEGYAVFWANDGDVAVRVAAVTGDLEPGGGGSWSVGDPVSVWIDVHRVAPGAVTVVAVAGALAGGVLGWLLAAWLLRAFARHTGGGRAVMALVGGLTLLIGTIGLVLPALVRVAGLASIDGWSPHDSLVAAATLWSARTLALAVGAGLIVVVLIAVAAPSREDQVPPVTSVPRAAGWAVALGLVTAALVSSVILAGLVAL